MATSSKTQTFSVGDVVSPTPESQFTLRSGAGWYPDAVCVCVQPYILVSQDADMLWSATIDKEDFKPVGTAPLAVLKRCMDRFYRDYPQAKPKISLESMDF